MKKISKDLFSDLVASSPLVCAFLLQMAKDDDQPTDFDYINAGIAMQSMLLCATHLGIGAQFLSLLADSDEGVASVSKIFNFSKEDRIVDILRLGYIDKKSKSKIITVSSNIRRPVERIVHFENFNEEGDGPLS